MKYQVILPKTVQKEMNRLPDDVIDRILDRLEELKVNPRPSDSKKLKGRPAWRIRVGDYRVIYEVHDRELRVIIITIGHLREVYR